MPIVDETHGGLKRYAVFAFVQDDKAGDQSSPALRFPMSPNASSLEASTKLGHTELFHMKRLKSLEKSVVYPYVDVTFFSSYQGVEEMKNLLEPSDCVNLHDHTITLQKGCFEEVQLVDPKRDMIMTPIDVDDVLTERLTGRGVTSQNKVPTSKSANDLDNEENYKKTRGYVVIAFKTMEHMYSREFVSSWKTWTGVRYICMQLPRQLGLRRIAFYRQITTTADFTYVLLIEITNLLVYSAQTLNLMDGIKLRLCGYTGIYRETNFLVDLATASAQKIETNYVPPVGPFDTPRINVSRHDSAGLAAAAAADDLAALFKKQNEIANKRRQEQELAARIEEQRKAKMFKLFSRQDSVPDYAPPPPPPGLDVPRTIHEHSSAGGRSAAPKASPESPDMSPPPTPPRRLPPPVNEKLSKQRIAEAMKQRQAVTDMPAVHGAPMDKRRDVVNGGGMPTQVQVVQPTFRSAASDFYAPIEPTVTKPQIAHSSQIRSPGRYNVNIIQDEQQIGNAQQRLPLPSKAEPHRMPPPYGIYPPYAPLPVEDMSNTLGHTGSSEGMRLGIDAGPHRRRSEVELAKAGHELVVRAMQIDPMIKVELINLQPSTDTDSSVVEQNFNSPVYGRDEWRHGTALYPDDAGDRQMAHLAQKLGSMKETAILTEDDEYDKRKRDGGSIRRKAKHFSSGVLEALGRRGSRRDKSGRSSGHANYRDRSQSYGSSSDRSEHAVNATSYGGGISLAARRQVYFHLQEKSRQFLDQYPSLAKHRKSMPGSTHELLMAFETGELDAEFKAKNMRKDERSTLEKVTTRERPDVVDIIEPTKAGRGQKVGVAKSDAANQRRALPRIPVLAAAGSPSPPIYRSYRPAGSGRQSARHEQSVPSRAIEIVTTPLPTPHLRQPSAGRKSPATVASSSSGAGQGKTTMTSSTSERRQRLEAPDRTRVKRSTSPSPSRSKSSR